MYCGMIREAQCIHLASRPELQKGTIQTGRMLNVVTTCVMRADVVVARTESDLEWHTIVCAYC